MRAPCHEQGALFLWRDRHRRSQEKRAVAPRGLEDSPYAVAPRIRAGAGSGSSRLGVSHPQEAKGQGTPDHVAHHRGQLNRLQRGVPCHIESAIVPVQACARKRSKSTHLTTRRLRRSCRQGGSEFSGAITHVRQVIEARWHANATPRKVFDCQNAVATGGIG